MTLAEENIIFHFQLGKAIVAWSNVEDVLRSILCVCFEKGNENIHWNALSVGFFSIAGFQTKLSFVDGVVSRRFPTHNKPWKNLVDKTKAASDKRNKLAHWAVKEYAESNAGRRFVL